MGGCLNCFLVFTFVEIFFTDGKFSIEFSESKENCLFFQTKKKIEFSFYKDPHTHMPVLVNECTHTGIHSIKDSSVCELVRDRKENLCESLN